MLWVLWDYQRRITQWYMLQVKNWKVHYKFVVLMCNWWVKFFCSKRYVTEGILSQRCQRTWHTVIYWFSPFKQMYRSNCNDCCLFIYACVFHWKNDKNKFYLPLLLSLSLILFFARLDLNKQFGTILNPLKYPSICRLQVPSSLICLAGTVCSLKWFREIQFKIE